MAAFPAESASCLLLRSIHVPQLLLLVWVQQSPANSTGPDPCTAPLSPVAQTLLDGGGGWVG